MMFCYERCGRDNRMHGETDRWRLLLSTSLHRPKKRIFVPVWNYDKRWAGKFGPLIHLPLAVRSQRSILLDHKLRNQCLRRRMLGRGNWM